MGSFCMAFEKAEDAIGWCTEVQNELLKVSWPESLVKHLTMDNSNDEEQQEVALMAKVPENSADIGPKMDHGTIPEKDRMSKTTKQEEKKNDKAGRKGIRVRMGVHCGVPSSFLVDPITRKHAYNGKDVDLAACMVTLAHGGQVIYCTLINLIFFFFNFSLFFQVLVSNNVVKKLNGQQRFFFLGDFHFPCTSHGMYLVSFVYLFRMHSNN